jgi:transcriptional regulator with XRE-family HTH domain
VYRTLAHSRSPVYRPKMDVTSLGDFLRSRRDTVNPADLGLPDVGPRRVPGLRREEVAVTAGVSVDYYVRLEQGRERHPSPQILDALAAVLQLDGDGRLHLFRLAGLAPRPRSMDAVERIDPGLLELMENWPDNPALVFGRGYDVLAGNRLGMALFNDLDFSRNLVQMLFLDPRARTFYVDWEAAARSAVAGLRLAAGVAEDDPAVMRVVTYLLQRSAEFREFWANRDARGKTLEVKSFLHPEVGHLTLRMQAFDVRSAPGQQLVIYHAEAGSGSAEALTLLGTIAATRAIDPARPAT